jgi:hypothetical protein
MHSAGSIGLHAPSSHGPPVFGSSPVDVGALVVPVSVLVGPVVGAGMVVLAVASVSDVEDGAGEHANTRDTTEQNSADDDRIRRVISRRRRPQHRFSRVVA